MANDGALIASMARRLGQVAQVALYRLWHF
eukprot:COSAG04_NODE_1121_length_8162_cov_9.527595_1_plen_29_part_10